jgi:hypothetical protein
MFHHALIVALLAGPSVLAIASPGPGAKVDPLGSYLWKRRVLLVTAPAPGDPLLAEQRHRFAAMQAGARDRDLVLVEAVGKIPGADALRKRFGIEPAAFQALLIGKDGTEKLRSDAPLGPDRLFPTIDGMPMRREEAARRPNTR